MLFCRWTHATLIAAMLLTAFTAQAGIDAGLGEGTRLPRDLFRRVKPAVVQIVALDEQGKRLSSGSGFMVSKDGKVVTNHHVIAHGERFEVRFSDGAKLPVVGIVRDEPTFDLAVLQVEGDGFSTVPLGDSDALVEGEPIALVGNPLGLTWTYVEGIVSSIRPEGLPEELLVEEYGAVDADRKPVLQLTVNAAPGNSGGPVFNSLGEAVGVIRSTYGESGGITFAIPSKTVAAVLASSTPPTERTGRNVPWLNLGISLGVFIVIGTVWRYRSRGRSR